MTEGGRLVGRLPRSLLDGGALYRLDYPPFHVLVAMVDGRPTAIEDACNHAGASLSEGERRGGCVVCPMHGYVFDLGTGRLVAPITRVPLCSAQRRFVAQAVGEEIVVWDPELGATLLGP